MQSEFLIKNCQRIFRIEFLRYLVSGSLNTAITMLLYFALKLFFSYQIAYLLAYFFGIQISYFFNLCFVFKQKFSFKSFISYPLNYFFSYLFSATILWVFVEIFMLENNLAITLSLFITIPASYFLIKKSILKD